MKPKIFISHSYQDKEFVHKLAKDLAAEGITPWVDDWEIKVGDSLVQKISEGIRQSDYILVILSKNSINSKWVQKEIKMAFQKSPAGAKRVIIPVLCEKIEVPSYIRDIKYADLSESYQKGIDEIVRAVRPPQEKPPSIQFIDAGGLANEIAREEAHILKVNSQGIRVDNTLSKDENIDTIYNLNVRLERAILEIKDLSYENDKLKRQKMISNILLSLMIFVIILIMIFVVFR